MYDPPPSQARDSSFQVEGPKFVDIIKDVVGGLGLPKFLIVDIVLFIDFEALSQVPRWN